MNATCYRVTALKNGAYTISPVHIPAYAYYACVKPDSCSLDTAGQVRIQWIVDTSVRWHCELRGQVVLCVRLPQQVSVVCDFVHSRGDSIFFNFRLLHLLNLELGTCVTNITAATDSRYNNKIFWNKLRTTKVTK
jgi:hypothetical protein